MVKVLASAKWAAAEGVVFALLRPSDRELPGERHWTASIPLAGCDIADCWEWPGAGNMQWGFAGPQFFLGLNDVVHKTAGDAMRSLREGTQLPFGKPCSGDTGGLDRQRLADDAAHSLLLGWPCSLEYRTAEANAALEAHLDRTGLAQQPSKLQLENRKCGSNAALEIHLDRIGLAQQRTELQLTRTPSAAEEVAAAEERWPTKRRLPLGMAMHLGAWRKAVRARIATAMVGWLSLHSPRNSAEVLLHMKMHTYIRMVLSKLVACLTALVLDEVDLWLLSVLRARRAKTVALLPQDCTTTKEDRILFGCGLAEDWQQTVWIIRHIASGGRRTARTSDPEKKMASTAATVATTTPGLQSLAETGARTASVDVTLEAASPWTPAGMPVARTASTLRPQGRVAERQAGHAAAQRAPWCQGETSLRAIDLRLLMSTARPAPTTGGKTQNHQGGLRQAAFLPTESPLAQGLLSLGDRFYEEKMGIKKNQGKCGPLERVVERQSMRVYA
jgi:hypothetical protein